MRADDAEAGLAGAHYVVVVFEETQFELFIERAELATGSTLRGPLVITQFDATTLVPPGSRVAVDASGDLLIEVDA